jgi:hypothetical protein
MVKKPQMVTLLPMPDRYISVINNWSKCHAKEDAKHSLVFLNCKKQLYNWDNDNLQDNKGLVDPDPDNHPGIPAKFSSINLKLEQPCHHHVVKVIKASNKERIYAAVRNASLNDLPPDIPGVTTAVNKIEVDGWLEHTQIYKDPYNDLPTHPTIATPPTIDIPTKELATPPTMAPTHDTKEDNLGSIIVDGRRRSSHTPAPRHFTKIGFNRKSYPNRQYKDGTIHITTCSHNANHPSPINPGPLMHALDTAILHYANPDYRAIAFAQVYIKAGHKTFGNIGANTAITKLTQLHDYQVYNPAEATSLTPAISRKTALKLLMNIIKKQDGHVHARAIADRSKERRQPGYKKEDNALPTVATDSIMITATIDAHKGHDIATVNILGAFLHAYNNKDTFMLLHGCLAKLMVQVDPMLYRKYNTYGKNNKPLLYFKLSKAIYGLLKSALLFYKRFVDDLTKYSSPFTINPYNPCIANATVAGYQMTITWHVNDLKILHIDPFQVTKFCQYLASIYGNGLVVHHSKIHEYLSTDLNFALDGVVQVSMITYTSKVILDFPKSITTSCTSLAGDHLFTIRDATKVKFLPEEQAQAFHHTVSQLLFLCKHTQCNIQTAVSFLTTCIKHPDEDNWGKLKQVLRYLHGTCHIKLNLSANNLTTIRW